jgi:hypothetical protein
MFKKSHGGFPSLESNHRFALLEAFPLPLLMKGPKAISKLA